MSYSPRVTTMTGSQLLRALDRATSRPCWLAFGAFVSVALGKAALAEPLPAPAPAPQPVLDSVVKVMAAQEQSFRQRAERNFPGDAWSQDDDFHAHEQQLARRLAQQHGISLGQVLRAWDDELRRLSRSGPDPKPRNSVPPCRPRPVY